MKTIAEIIQGRGRPAPVSTKLSREWQFRALADMKKIGIEKLTDEFKGRVFAVYKNEAEGLRKYKATTNHVISYLTDKRDENGFPLSYRAKLLMFFKLVSNGFSKTWRN